MSRAPFRPTDEQKAVIAHSGSAFISACPGGGKTQVLVERARQQLKITQSGQGLAFLSFTNAAISELKRRLQLESLLPSPPFPHYIGTFDSFVWQFFIAPLGIPGQARAPRLIPDIDDRPVVPYKGAHQLPLSCFDRLTGKIASEKAKRFGFDAAANVTLTARYEAAARRWRERLIERGELGFSDVRPIVSEYLANVPLSRTLSAALAARFREVVVDEAQDCNPADIEIINWLRAAGIATKIICDPHQSIYQFRGGVTDELFELRDSFRPGDRLAMNGNFRSNPNICRAISAFRAPNEQNPTDESSGPTADDATAVHILHYPGRSIPSSIGHTFESLIRKVGLDPLNCPVVSSARDAACAAVGQPADAETKDRTLRLALAVTSFQAALEVNARIEGLENLHAIVLELSDKIGEQTYHEYIAAEEIRPEAWRPEILLLMQALRFSPARDATADAWLARARQILTPYMSVHGASIAQRLKKHHDLAVVLDSKPVSSLGARTIHSVKGMEFPGVCVVLSATTCKGIIDYLLTGQPSDSAEGARKLYVAASRAERLLVIAVPNSQGARLVAHIKKTGAELTETHLS